MGSGQWWMIHLPCFRVNPGHHVSVRSGRYLPQQKCPVLWQATGRICLEISVGFCVGSAGHPNTSWRFGVLDPTGSMYGVFTFIYHKNQPNVGRYTSPMDPVGILVLQTSSQFRCLDVKVSRSHSWNFKVLLVVEPTHLKIWSSKNAGRLRIQLWGGVTPVSRGKPQPNTNSFLAIYRGQQTWWPSATEQDLCGVPLKNQSLATLSALTKKTGRKAKEMLLTCFSELQNHVRLRKIL